MPTSSPVVLQRRSCLLLPGESDLHPAPLEPGSAHTEMLYIDPLACGGLAVPASVPVRSGRSFRTLSAQCRTTTVPRGQRRFYPPRPDGFKVPPTVALAPVLTVAQGAARRDAADGGDRRLRAGWDVRRRRTAHPARGAGQRVRQTADPYGLVPRVALTTRAPKGVTRLFDDQPSAGI